MHKSMGRLFKPKTKPSVACRIMAIDKGLHKKTSLRRIKAKHAGKYCVGNSFAMPSDASMVNARKYKRGDGLSRFE